MNPNERYELYVNSVVDKLFPDMNYSDKQMLGKYTVRVIHTIKAFFSIDPKLIMTQLSQNDHQDTKWIILHLLPHLNKTDGLQTISSIYTAKENDVNIADEEPKYTYSNLQYGRFLRGTKRMEYEYKPEDIQHNYYLILDTIRTMSNKMCVNWMDILPYTTRTYHKSQLFLETQKRFNNNNYTEWDPVIDGDFNMDEEDFTKRLSEKATGLYIGDIYNVLSLDLYNSILNTKWLLYDIIVGDDIMPLVVVLAKTMGIRPMLEDKTWDALEPEYRNNFIRTWTNYINGSLKSLHLTPGGYKRLILGLLIAFDNYNKKVEHTGYIKLTTLIDFENYDQALPSINSINPEHLYSFITNSLQEFKYTWYGTKLLNPEKSDIGSEHYYLKPSASTPPITYKNIYNYAENIVHEYSSSEQRMGDYWCSLTNAQKREFLRRINDENTRWFKITRNLHNIISQQTETGKDWVRYLRVYGVSETVKTIRMKIRESLPNIIFEALIFKGVLSKFVPNKEKTDKYITSRSDVWTKQKDVLQDHPNNEYWTSAYHYLTRLPYCHMPEFTVKRGTYNFFSFATASKGHAWYTLYAYDWISQLGFCHHYLHSRVQFVTGATGVGKSTEIPKLFLYNSIALDYKNNTRIVCTQTRISATGRNAEWVALTLGVPIITSDNIVHNYYIQMRHGRESNKYHKKDAKHPVLEYITDGLLYNSMKMPNGRDKERNMYDIYLIDEAHEHNPNIDLILTLLRTTLIYNNTIKLVIVSATMDEDEPRYRRYYRDINDNRKYPLNIWLGINKLDRVNIDRRYHISPPGIGTNFPVQEIYQPTWDVYMAVNHIISNNATGDILVFEPGETEITEVVNNLNKTLPYDTVAVPYYGGIEQEVRDVIEGIAERINEIKMARENIKSLRGVSYAELTAGSNVYKRAVIVATNAAEASITIESLRFVVDTGTQKVSIYDPRRNLTMLETVYISESSRVQRKGRVGRKAPGTVYFLYEEGKMTNNKTIFSICSKDLSMDLFRYLKTDIEDPHVLAYNQLDNIRITVSLSRLSIDTKIQEFVRHNYFINGGYYKYYGNISMYDYDNYPAYHEYYQTGFHVGTLLDPLGEFYLIHPEEIHLKRNLFGEIVGVTSDYDIVYRGDGSIYSFKMDNLWLNSLRHMYVINYNYQYFKTHLGFFLTEFQTAVIEYIPDPNLIRLLFYSTLFGTRHDITKYIALCVTTGNKPLSIFKPNSLILKNKFNSDIGGVISIINDYPDSGDRQSWCDNMGLNYDVMKEYYNNYKILLEQVLTKFGPQMDNYFKLIKERITNSGFLDNKDDLLSLTLLFTYPNNVYRKIEKSNYYLSVPDNSLLSMCTAPHNTSRILNRIISDDYLDNYVLFTDFDMRKNTMKGIHYITPRVISKYNIMYNSETINLFVIDENSIVRVKQIVESKYNEKTYREFGCHLNPWLYNCNYKLIYTNIINAITNYQSTIELFKTEFMNEVDKHELLYDIFGIIPGGSVKHKFKKHKKIDKSINYNVTK